MRDDTRPVCFFNNCHGRDHVRLFGAGAFFDLGISGRQAAQARDLVPGQLCVVGSYNEDGGVIFGWYMFSREALLPYDDDQVRVFFGRFLASEPLAKQRAARSRRYCALFKTTGDFKQGSVFWSDLRAADYPDAVQRWDAGSERNDSKPTAGAGFGNPAENTLVEAAAIRAVVAWYENDGWKVKSVERERCGFDLHCAKDGVSEDVEVKGVRGSERSFMITQGEVHQARTNPRFVLRVVTLALSPSPVIDRYSGAEFRQRFQLSPIQYRAALSL